MSVVRAPHLSRAVLFGVSTLLACSTPTGMCACPPARSIAYLRGVVTGADGGAITNASVRFEEPIPNTTHYVAIDGNGARIVTDSMGAYRALVYSMGSPGARPIRAVVGLARNDTVRVDAGIATFRRERERPDTIRIDLRLASP